MSRAADWLDPGRSYRNAAFIPGSEALPALWAEAAASFRLHRPPQELAYGPHARQRLDLFRPEAAPRGLLVFVHGGYWLEFGKADWSHLAAGALARGWACAIPGYRLAPEVGIDAITADVKAAVTALRPLVPGALVVTGHSAGGHLAARMGCADGPGGVARVVPISPLAELAPLAATGMQKTLQITESVAASESPARLAPARGTQAHVWVGAAERPAFLWQARVLAEAWACPWTVEPGRHHFDVIDALADPASALIGACLDGL